MTQLTKEHFDKIPNNSEQWKTEAAALKSAYVRTISG